MFDQIVSFYDSQEFCDLDLVSGCQRDGTRVVTSCHTLVLVSAIPSLRHILKSTPDSECPYTLIFPPHVQVKSVVDSIYRTLGGDLKYSSAKASFWTKSLGLVGPAANNKRKACYLPSTYSSVKRSKVEDTSGSSLSVEPSAFTDLSQLVTSLGYKSEVEGTFMASTKRVEEEHVDNALAFFALGKKGGRNVVSVVASKMWPQEEAVRNVIDMMRHMNGLSLRSVLECAKNKFTVKDLKIQPKTGDEDLDTTKTQVERYAAKVDVITNKASLQHLPEEETKLKFHLINKSHRVNSYALLYGDSIGNLTVRPYQGTEEQILHDLAVYCGVQSPTELLPLTDMLEKHKEMVEKEDNLRIILDSTPYYNETTCTMENKKFKDVDDLLNALGEESHSEGSSFLATSDDFYLCSQKFAMPSLNQVAKLINQPSGLTPVIPDTKVCALLAIGRRGDVNVASVVASKHWSHKSLVHSMLTAIKHILGTSLRSILECERTRPVVHNHKGRALQRLQVQLKKMTATDIDTQLALIEEYEDSVADPAPKPLSFRYLPTSPTKLVFKLLPQSLSQNEIKDYAILSGRDLDNLSIQSYVTTDGRMLREHILPRLIDALAAFCDVARPKDLYSHVEPYRDILNRHYVKLRQKEAIEEFRNKEDSRTLLKKSSCSKLGDDGVGHFLLHHHNSNNFLFATLNDLCGSLVQSGTTSQQYFSATTDFYYLDGSRFKVPFVQQSNLKPNPDMVPVIPATSICAMLALGIRGGENVASVVATPFHNSSDIIHNMVDVMRKILGLPMSAIMECRRLKPSYDRSTEVARQLEIVKTMTVDERNNHSASVEKSMAELHVAQKAVKLTPLPTQPTRLTFKLLDHVLDPEDIVDYAILSGDTLDGLKIQSYVNVELMKSDQVLARFVDATAAFCGQSQSKSLATMEPFKTWLDNHYTTLCQREAMICYQTAAPPPPRFTPGRVCDVCKKTVPKRSYRMHRLAHIQCKCEDANFTTEVARRLHMHTVHLRKTVFKCQENNCNSFFMTAEGLDSHKRKKHFDSSQLEDGVGKICEDCGAHFRDSHSLSVHIRHHHRMFQCPICLLDFHGYNALERHKRNAHPEQHLCDNCGQSFTARKYLRKHVYEHHENRKVYSCTQCGQTFVNKLNMQSHYDASHLGLRKFECRGGCSRSFKFSTNRRRHEKKEHGFIIRNPKGFKPKGLVGPATYRETTVTYCVT